MSYRYLLSRLVGRKYFGLSLVGNLVKLGISQLKSGHKNWDVICLSVALLMVVFKVQWYCIKVMMRLIRSDCYWFLNVLVLLGRFAKRWDGSFFLSEGGWKVKFPAGLAVKDFLEILLWGIVENSGCGCFLSKKIIELLAVLHISVLFSIKKPHCHFRIYIVS